MDCVSSSHHDCWVSRASVAPNQAEAVFPPTIQPQRYTKFTTVTSLPRSHTLKGGMSKSYYRKSMRKGPIFIAIFGRHNVLTHFPDSSSLAWCHLITGSSFKCLPAVLLVDIGTLNLPSHLPLMAVPWVLVPTWTWFCSSPLFPLRVNPWVGKIPWRREWLLIPVLLPGEFQWTMQPTHSPWVAKSQMWLSN